MRFSARLVLLTVVLTVPAARADNWPQWLGPRRDSVWRETGILDKFPEDGPKVRWRVPIAGGYAGPAVAEGRVYVTDYVVTEGRQTNDPGQRDELSGSERILCFQESDGKLLWKRSYDCDYHISYPAGPRCTPTVADGKVYTLGAEGKLGCLDALTGKTVWSKDLKKEYRTRAPQWGFCGHPLVEGKTLYCLVGGEGSVAVAFDKDTGKELWRALSAREPGYCPPTLIEAGGKKQLLIWDAEALNSLDPTTGRVYWSESLEPQYGMSIAAPRQLGDYLFASGIGEVGALLKLDRDRPDATVVWRGKRDNAIYCANSTPFLEEGMIYGCDCGLGALRGVRLKTGERLWETFVPTTGGKRRASHGTAFLIKNGDRFFLLSETGDLIIAKLSPEKYQEVSRCKLLEPTGSAFGRDVLWSHPAFANRCIFARNDKELICASLAKEKE